MPKRSKGPYFVGKVAADRYEVFLGSGEQKRELLPRAIYRIRQSAYNKARRLNQIEKRKEHVRSVY